MNEQKVWLTTHSTDGKRVPKRASVTMNNFDFGFRVNEMYGDQNGFQIQTSPMGIQELNLIRKALNKYFKENNLI